MGRIPDWYRRFQTAVLEQLPRPGEIGQVTAKVWTSDEKGLKKNLADGLLLPTATLVELFGPGSLLEVAGRFTLPATTTRFIARDKFKLKRAGGICSCLNDDFTSWFMAGEGKIEDPMGEQRLSCVRLLKSLRDGRLIAELGGEAKAETTLSAMFYLMEEQKNGKAGVLLNNGYANIFILKDGKGRLCVVSAGWLIGGWRVRAHSVLRPRTWRAGSQVFFPV